VSEKPQAKPTGGQIATYLIIAIILTIITYAIMATLHLGAIGIEFPLVGFLLGLAVSATMKPPREVFRILNPWVLVDASLIILGLIEPFRELGALGGKAGEIAIVNIVVTLAVGMFIAYKLGIDERFAVTFVSGGTVCGISAAIATGRAANAEFAHLVMAMLFIAILGAPFAVFAAWAAHHLGAFGAALVGGVVDGTPMVLSIAKSLPANLGKIATAVKFAQDALIPIVAIVLAYVASRLSGLEIKLPLAIVLMFIMAIIGSFIHIPAGIAAGLHSARSWLLALAMVLAGMATPPSMLKKLGVKIAIGVFIIVEIVNTIVVALMAAALLG